MSARAEPATAESRPTAYRRFWHEVGNSFPDLGGAASTDYYRANEERLLLEHLPAGAGRRILKTDLWDEAKNTRILQWVAAGGARAFGVDISEPIVRLARRAFTSVPLAAAVADCRDLPYKAASFDAVYSMGTVEHFEESDRAVREMWRVLKPGGRAVIGVPNRLDPFLRPLVVAALSAAGLYAYGFEKSYSRRGLRAMLEACGFRVIAETGILFMPGWLRMLDLAFHAYAPAFAPVTAMMLRPFVWLDRRWPAVRRHGYLIVAIGEK